MLNGKMRPGLVDGRLRKRLVTPAICIHAFSLFYLPPVEDLRTLELMEIHLFGGLTAESKVGICSNISFRQVRSQKCFN